MLLVLKEDCKTEAMKMNKKIKLKITEPYLVIHFTKEKKDIKNIDLKEYIHTKTVAQWKKEKIPEIGKVPCIFVLGR